MSTRTIRWAAAPLAIGLFLAGCSDSKPDPDATSVPGKSSTTVATVPPSAEDHGHLPSQRGGVLVPIGRDRYHAEAVFEPGGVLRLYTLGPDGSQVQDVERQTLTGYVRLDGVGSSVQFELKPEPQSGDRPGTTSSFVGQVPKELVGGKLQVTIPVLRIGDNRYRISFTSTPESDHTDTAMPAKPVDEEERKLFLEPGGKYTTADVEANGRTTPTLKYRAVRPRHDAGPKAGDRICPISETKSNPEVSWIIGGKSYEFCCIPCIEEFLALAKAKPSEIRDPECYRKK